LINECSTIYAFLCVKINKMLKIKNIQASETWELRHRVMAPNRPFDSIKLLMDEEGLHFGLFKEEKLISVISLFIEKDMAQFRKFATEISEQNKGYGSILLNHVIEESIKNKVKNLWCNARMTALGFYEKFGFEAVSETWMDNNIEYVKMERTF
jgi:predicted GNAT family N-acyltransferase